MKPPPIPAPHEDSPRGTKAVSDGASPTDATGHTETASLLVPPLLVGTLHDYSLPTSLEYPPIAAALARGGRPAFTHRGRRAFYAWRRAQPSDTSSTLPALEARFVEFVVQKELEG